jgi:hypothetical protein
MSIDPRLVERRKSVAEDNAKVTVARLLKFMVALVGAGAIVWALFSPWLSVNQVDTMGIDASPAHSILVDQGVLAGTPMIQVNESDTEAALLADPWIASAVVIRHWPDRVSVEVVEREPLAWSNSAIGWTRRAVDGVALPSGPEPDAEMAHIEMADMTEDEIESSTDMTGALEFLEALPLDHHPGTVVTRLDGELWANVDGYQVRLGRSVEMTAKALSLDALLQQDIPQGSTLVLIAPTHPSYRTPGVADTAPDEESSDDGSVGEVAGRGEAAEDDGDSGGEAGDGEGDG